MTLYTACAIIIVTSGDRPHRRPKRVLTISPERHIMSRIIAIVATLLSLFSVTACSASTPPMPAPTKPVASPVETASPIATPSASPSALTDDQLKKEQVDKFVYMQDASRLRKFEESGYSIAKIKIAKDVMSGKYGEPVVEHITLYDLPALSVSVGEYDDNSRLYAWYFIYLDKFGNPDFNTVWNFAVMAPERDYIEIDDTFHDWPTVIEGSSVDLRYDASYGDTRMRLDAALCLWPNLDLERESCQGMPSGTKTAEDMRTVDDRALELMNEAMSDLYGPEWYKG